MERLCVNAEHAPAGKIKIESKEDARQRGVKSPEEEDGGDLYQIYLGAMHEADGSNLCAKCRERLGSMKTQGTDGKCRHPECA